MYSLLCEIVWLSRLKFHYINHVISTTFCLPSIIRKFSVVRINKFMEILYASFTDIINIQPIVVNLNLRLWLEGNIKLCRRSINWT